MGGDWSERAKAILREAMRAERLTYDDLAARLTAAGVPTSGPYLRKKVSLGGFSAAFFLQCLDLIGAADIRLR